MSKFLGGLVVGILLTVALMSLVQFMLRGPEMLQVRKAESIMFNLEQKTAEFHRYIDFTSDEAEDLMCVATKPVQIIALTTQPNGDMLDVLITYDGLVDARGKHFATATTER